MVKECTHGPRTENGRCPSKPKPCSGNRTRVNGKCPKVPCKHGRLDSGKCRGKALKTRRASSSNSPLNRNWRTKSPAGSSYFDQTSLKELTPQSTPRSASSSTPPVRKGVGKMRQVNGKFFRKMRSPVYSPNQSISTPDISLPRYTPKRPVRYDSPDPAYSPKGRSTNYSPNDPISPRPALSDSPDPAYSPR